jgi:hypothetical protein
MSMSPGDAAVLKARWGLEQQQQQQQETTCQLSADALARSVQNMLVVDAARMCHHSITRTTQQHVRVWSLCCKVKAWLM